MGDHLVKEFCFHSLWQKVKLVKYAKQSVKAQHSVLCLLVSLLLKFPLPISYCGRWPSTFSKNKSNMDYVHIAFLHRVCSVLLPVPSKAKFCTDSTLWERRPAETPASPANWMWLKANYPACHWGKWKNFHHRLLVGWKAEGQRACRPVINGCAGGSLMRSSSNMRQTSAATAQRLDVMWDENRGVSGATNGKPGKQKLSYYTVVSFLTNVFQSVLSLVFYQDTLSFFF